MILSLGINLEEETTPPATKFAVHVAILAGTVLVMALFLGPLVRQAIADVRQHRVATEWLFLLTLGGAFTASMQSLLTGSGPVYFEVVSVLLVVYTVGKALGAHSRKKALDQADEWFRPLEECRLVEASHTRTVSRLDIQPGHVVEVHPGETVPVDGVIHRGTCLLAEGAVRGEPFAVVREPSDDVLAGSIVHDATIHITATRPGTQRQLDQLLALVEAARRSPSNMQGYADRLAAIMLPLIVLVALGTFLVWQHRASTSMALFHALSVLLVACPCALGLATPIVMWNALGRLTERGIVLHTGHVLERLATITRVVFDKTGTLTDEQVGIMQILTAVEGAEREHILSTLARIQEQSSHPFARPFAAFVAHTEEAVTDFHIVPGRGVEATIHGEHWQIGRPEWLAPVLPTWATSNTAGHRIVCTRGGNVVAVAIVQERLRDSVPAMMAEFARMGIPVAILTGDTRERADALGLPNAQGNLLPMDKERLIRAWQQEGDRVLMIGDGINDAAALAVADVGLALSHGTDLANHSAAATLYHDDLRVVPWLVALAWQANRIIRRNLALAFAYNLVGITVAACGLLHPVLAALLMVTSSLVVTWTAARVGVRVEHECAPITTVTPLAMGHTLAVILQGLILISLFGIPLPWGWVVVGGIAVVGVGSAWWWAKKRWSHEAEMAYIMLTFGNAGMIGGWWIDAGFRPLEGSATCDCATAIFTGVVQPWMWIGMFVLGNVGMAFFAKHRHAQPWAMYTGGNVGMGVGMLLGGWLAAQYPWANLQAAGWISLVGMTMGMIAGMSVGTHTVRWAWRRLWAKRPA